MRWGKVGKMSGCGLLLSVMLLLWAGNAPAASFDCAKAGTAVEKMICGDAGLSKLDEEMSGAYKAASQRCENEDKAQLKSAQLQWLKERNNCADSVCIRKSYQTKIDDLTASCTDKPRYAFCLDVRPQEECYPFWMSDCTSGKGNEVCELYLSYLNNLPKMPLCEVPVPPGFQRPEWEYLNVMENLDWAYRAEYLINKAQVGSTREYQFPDRKSWEKELLEQARAGTLRPVMRKTRVKPLGSEEEITILAYIPDSQVCPRTRGGRDYQLFTYSDRESLLGRNGGYAHFQISTEEDVSLGIKPGNLLPILFASGGAAGAEMLFFKNIPYMIQISHGSYGGQRIENIYIYSFEKSRPPYFVYKETCFFLDNRVKYPKSK